MLGRLINSLDPRLSLAARIGWVFGSFSIILSLLAGLYFGNLSQIAIEQQIGELYANRAAHIADAVDLKIQSGTSAMHLAVSLLGMVGEIDNADANRKLISTIKQNIDGSVWIGITDSSGRVLAGDDQRLENVSLAEQNWFKAAMNGRYVAGPEQFPELENLLGPQAGGRPHNFLLITEPMTDGVGAIIGYAVACFDMGWINEAQQIAGESLVGMRPVDIFLLDGEGKLLNQMLEGDPPPEIEFSDRINETLKSVPSGIALGSFATDNYLVGFAKSKGYADFKGTDWTVVVREAKQSAYLPAYKAAAAIAISCLALSLGLSFSAVFGTKIILRGLTQIAGSADALKAGHASEFAAIGGQDEVARISQSLATLFNNQKMANEQLADLNRNLDRKVADRTREVQRLSEETKNVAITRERLRISRDLHDTLAQSMLATLTQIRLLQKLLKSKPELIEEELTHAERAAQDGLNLARDAVTGLRYFAIRDDGLEQALKKLVRNLKERVEIEVALEIDDAASNLAGPKIETVYRIAEEALRNVGKHADASHVNIRVDLDQADPANHLLKLSVDDDGRGFDPGAQSPGHFGLLGMQEQADILGGKFAIISNPKEGTRIRLEVSI
jgi:signal transduction histidine kinase